MVGSQNINLFLAWIHARLSKVNLDAAGLIALADLGTVAERTAIAGTSSWLDLFVLCPGLHRQQDAAELSKGEYPAVAALTTGYVFRVENEATVLYLQKVGVTGHLTNIQVSKGSGFGNQGTRAKSLSSPVLAQLFYFLPALSTFVVLSTLVLDGDLWGSWIVAMLICSRACNAALIYLRSRPGWKGMPEPGKKGDLLVLLSQDRWVRMKGLVDDLKLVTSGHWLRDMSFVESSVAGFAKVLVYGAAVLTANASQAGKALLLFQLLVSLACLGISNHLNASFRMHGCVLEKAGSPKKYERRLNLAEELTKETGRDDWAIRLGMTVPNKSTEASKEKDTFKEHVTM